MLSRWRILAVCWPTCRGGQHADQISYPPAVLRLEINNPHSANPSSILARETMISAALPGLRKQTKQPMICTAHVNSAVAGPACALPQLFSHLAKKNKSKGSQVGQSCLSSSSSSPKFGFHNRWLEGPLLFTQTLRISLTTRRRLRRGIYSICAGPRCA